jgi:hypothetical protein
VSRATAADLRREDEIAAVLARQWRCELRTLGKYSPVDRWAMRDGAVVAVVEIKARNVDSDRYPTVFLAARKWVALTLAAAELCVPALFVVGFHDGVFWLDLDDLADLKRPRLAGHAVPRCPNDLEPMHDVPVSAMRRAR